MRRKTIANINFLADSVLPTVVFRTNAKNPERSSPILVTADFSEPVEVFSLSMVAISSGVASDLVTRSDDSFSFRVHPTAPSVTVRINLPGSVTHDKSGNPNMPASELAVVYDEVPPMVQSLVTSVSSPTSISPIPVIVTFTEPIFGFDAEKVMLSGGMLRNFVQVSPEKFTFEIRPSLPSGAITINVPDGVGTDAAGNKNIAASLMTIVHGTTSFLCSIAHLFVPWVFVFTCDPVFSLIHILSLTRFCPSPSCAIQ